MEIAEAEYKKKKKATSKVEKKKSVVPEWVDKEVEEDIATEEEIKKLESRMKRS